MPLNGEPVVIVGADKDPTEQDRLLADLARIDAACGEWTRFIEHAMRMRRELGRMRAETVARLLEIDNR